MGESKLSYSSSLWLAEMGCLACAEASDGPRPAGAMRPPVGVPPPRNKFGVQNGIEAFFKRKRDRLPPRSCPVNRPFSEVVQSWTIHIDSILTATIPFLAGDGVNRHQVSVCLVLPWARAAGRTLAHPRARPPAAAELDMQTAGPAG